MSHHLHPGVSYSAAQANHLGTFEKNIDSITSLCLFLNKHITPEVEVGEVSGKRSAPNERNGGGGFNSKS